MRASTIAVALSALGVASAHTVFSQLYIDGVDQGAGTCLRIKPEYDNRNFPISPSSKEMACGRVDSAFNNQSSSLLTLLSRPRW